jgi:hypothetical protein
VYFLRNERGLGVKNGTLGTVKDITGYAAGQGERLAVRLDDGRVVGFDVKDYAHIDHGYAATVHKSQGVTVDRTHVLASSHMDRHATYVGLSRHRERVDLHWSADQVGDRERLTRVLGRERLKDTSLDYGLTPGGTAKEPGIPRDSDDSMRRYAGRYAERRGLVPVSEIVLRERPVASEPVVSAPPRRSKFAGLRLGIEAATERSRTLEDLTSSMTQPRQGQTPDTQLTRAMGDYARARLDAARMEHAGLPVLAHQALALERAGQALEATATNLSRDVRAALERTPALANDHRQAEGMAAFNRAVTIERHGRLVLEERGRATMREWDALDRAYEAAGKGYRWDEQREVATRMETFANALKRDPPLDRLLRERGRELGLAEGSRLDRVVQSQDATLTRELRHELGLSQGRGMSLGY